MIHQTLTLAAFLVNSDDYLFEVKRNYMHDGTNVKQKYNKSKLIFVFLQQRVRNPNDEEIFDHRNQLHRDRAKNSINRLLAVVY